MAIVSFPEVYNHRISMIVCSSVNMDVFRGQADEVSLLYEGKGSNAEFSQYFSGFNGPD